MDSEFLLTTPAARTLYHDYAEEMPIIDYHCHLSPAEIAEDRRFTDLSEVWLGGDHYNFSHSHARSSAARAIRSRTGRISSCAGILIAI